MQTYGNHRRKQRQKVNVVLGERKTPEFLVQNNNALQLPIAVFVTLYKGSAKFQPRLRYRTKILITQKPLCPSEAERLLFFHKRPRQR